MIKTGKVAMTINIKRKRKKLRKLIIGTVAVTNNQNESKYQKNKLKILMGGMIRTPMTIKNLRKRR